MRKIIFSFLLIFFLFLFSYTNTKAVDSADCEKEDIPEDKISECIDYLSGKVSELGSQKKTLASQIAQFDGQIKLTQVKIADAEATIAKLEKEISALGFKIDYVNESVGKIESLLKQRIVATYQQGYISNLELIVASQDFSDLILRVQYLKQVQENDKRILLSLQQSKADFGNQKDEREQKQAAIEENKKKLESLKVSLDGQKASKQVLLNETQNNEARYQKLLIQAQAELAIAFGGGTETKLRTVSEGESIGTVISGSSGCSTGTHLHFEVHKDSSIQDPNDYLSSKSVNYPYGEGDSGSINPHGSWPWPLNDPINITQGYGNTPYAQSGAYSGKPHYGIDMYSSSLAVKAASSGELYGGSYQCSNGTLYYAKIKHNDGVDSLYLHMIPK